VTCAHGGLRDNEVRQHLSNHVRRPRVGPTEFVATIVARGFDSEGAVVNHYDKDARRWTTPDGAPLTMPAGDIPLPGWVCPFCFLFNGTLKGRTVCRGCGKEKPS
jgi:hypothetical protein